VLDAGELELVRKILAGVARSGQRFGRRKVAAMLVGQVDELPDVLRSLTTTGLLANERPQDIEQWIDAARGAGLVAESSDQYRTLSLTTLGREVMAGRMREVTMSPPLRQSERSARRRVRTRRDRPSLAPRNPGRQAKRGGAGMRPATDPVTTRAETSAGRRDDDAAIEEALRAWRLALARQQGVPPYVVLHDSTLLAIVTARPHTTEQLRRVPGMGPVRVEKHGAAILAILEAGTTR
jgi:ATP-dependent DNA helicase RecQ